MDNRKKNDRSKADYYSSKENFRDDELIDDDLENDPHNYLSEYEIEKLENASDEQLLQLEIDKYNLDLLEIKLMMIYSWVGRYSREFSDVFWDELLSNLFIFICRLIGFVGIGFFIGIVLYILGFYEWLINLFS